MDNDASGNTLYTNPAVGNPAESSLPEPEPSRGIRGVKIPKALILVASSLLIIVVIITAVYFLVNRRDPGVDGVSTESAQEYQNANGFKFSYPVNAEVAETADGVMVSGGADIAFVVSNADAPLSETVESVSENFGSAGTETQTINGRMGFRMEYEGNVYYYFPLIEDTYLEIVDREPENPNNSSILSSLVFTPPQARLN